jgi:hypothetical protein
VDYKFLELLNVVMLCCKLIKEDVCQIEFHVMVGKIGIEGQSVKLYISCVKVVYNEIYKRTGR